MVARNEINRGHRGVDVVNIPRQAPPREVEVLVVGGGPSGLATALELSHDGVDVAVVDAATSALLARAGAMGHSPRAVELFRRWGVLDAIRAGWTFPPEWNVGTRLRTSLVGHDLADGPGRTFDKRRGSTYSFEDPIRRPQTVVQAAFLDKLVAERVVIAGGWRVTDFREDDTGVTVDVVQADSGQHRQVRAKFVVGADGSRSDVRRIAGIERDGAYADARQFRFVARIREYPKELGQAYSGTNVIVNDRYSGFLSAISETDWRLYAGPYPLGVEPTNDELLELTDAAFGVHVDAEIVSVTSFYKSTRIAQRFRKGRVVLVGDAAHVRTPGGNLGEGFGDVVNLGWKLAAVVRGHGGEALLDSYDAERRPHNHRVADFAYQRGAATELAVSEARALGIPADDDVTDGAVERRAQIGALLQRGSGPQPGVVFDERYDRSPVVWYEGASEETTAPWAPETYEPSGRPGTRAPNGNVDPFGGTLYDRLRADLALLVLSDEVSAVDAFERAATARSLEIEVIYLPDADARSAYGAPYALVRPDHHVAWRGEDAFDAGAILDRVLGTLPAPAQAETEASLPVHGSSLDLIGASQA